MPGINRNAGLDWNGGLGGSGNGGGAGNSLGGDLLYKTAFPAATQSIVQRVHVPFIGSEAHCIQQGNVVTPYTELIVARHWRVATESPTVLQVISEPGEPLDRITLDAYCLTIWRAGS